MRRLRDEQRRVRMMPRAGRALDAVGHLMAACANSTVRGVAIVLIDHNGECDARVFGDVRRKDLCYAGAVFTKHGLSDDGY